MKAATGVLKTKIVLKNFAIFTGKHLCWSVFLIKNFKANLLKRNSNTIAFLWILRNFTITCFKEQLWTAASIRCYFDTTNLNQSGFCTTYSFKILVSEYIYNSHVYYKIPWFYQHFKENLFFKSVLSSHSENTGPVTRDHFKSSQMRNETPLQL